MNNLLLILVGSIFVNNFVLVKFMGICPFLGVSRKLETAFGMGMAVTFVMGMASLVIYFVQNYVLVPLDLVYMQTIAFIVVIAVLVQLVEMVLRKVSFSLYQALGVYLPLITTNCAVLGVTILNVNNNYNLIESVVNGVGGALGFTLAIVLFAGIRERMELMDLPEWMDGFPAALITAGLMSVAILGFSGLIHEGGNEMSVLIAAAVLGAGCQEIRGAGKSHPGRGARAAARRQLRRMRFSGMRRLCPGRGRRQGGCEQMPGGRRAGGQGHRRDHGG